MFIYIVITKIKTVQNIDFFRNVALWFFSSKATL